MMSWALRRGDTGMMSIADHYPGIAFDPEPLHVTIRDAAGNVILDEPGSTDEPLLIPPTLEAGEYEIDVAINLGDHTHTQRTHLTVLPEEAQP